MTPLAVFLRFLRFGLLAWGGPVAQIAMIRRELVEEERWIAPERFDRLLAAYQLLPGPEAHELCVHLGMVRGGRLGGLAAGLGFMLPGLLLVLGAAWLYLRIDLGRPPLPAILLGLQLGVIAIIAIAVRRIAGHMLVDRWRWGIAVVVAGATLLGMPFWLALPAAGLAYLWAGRRWAVGLVPLIVLLGLGIFLVLSPDAAGPSSRSVPTSSGPLPLFLTGLKAGLLTFGGAYTAIPFVRDDTVGRGWIGEGAFIDSLALTGVLPGPLVLFATFVGVVAGGLAGGLALTLGLFVPAFAFALLWFDRIERVVERTSLHRLLDGVAAGVVGLIAVTAGELAVNVLRSAPSLAQAVVIMVVALAILLAWRSRLAVPVTLVATAVLGYLVIQGAVP